MRFISTRGGGEPCGFMHVLARGRAPDGGLYLPEEWPRLTSEEMALSGHRPLAETASALLARFAGRELDPELALAITREALTAFAHPAVTPLRELQPNLWLLDMAQGPTLSSADFEMQMLARLIEKALVSPGRATTLLLASRGDDGPAAVEAFRDRAGLGLVVLFPSGQLDGRRRRMMTDPAAGNVRAVEVAGSFEDCRALVAALLDDEALSGEVGLGSVGAENPARTVLQMSLLLSAFARLGAPERPVALAAPAGEFALGFAGWALSRMGAPVQGVIAAGGGGDPLLHAMQGARHQPALDVSGGHAAWSSGFERLYFESTGRHAVETVRAGRAFAEAGAIDLPPRSQAFFASRFTGVQVEPREAAAAMMAALNVAGERLEPETAAITVAARRSHLSDSGVPVIAPVLRHPALSSAAMSRVTGTPVELPPQWRDLDSRPERCERIAADPDALRAYVRSFAGLSRAA